MSDQQPVCLAVAGAGPRGLAPRAVSAVALLGALVLGNMLAPNGSSRSPGPVRDDMVPARVGGWRLEGRLPGVYDEPSYRYRCPSRPDIRCFLQTVQYEGAAFPNVLNLYSQGAYEAVGCLPVRVSDQTGGATGMTNLYLYTRFEPTTGGPSTEAAPGSSPGTRLLVMAVFTDASRLTGSPWRARLLMVGDRLSRRSRLWSAVFLEQETSATELSLDPKPDLVQFAEDLLPHLEALRRGGE